MGQARSIKGTAVAPGLAMAPVHVVRAAPKVVPTWSLREDEVERELERLDRAMQSVAAELERRRQRVIRSAGEHEAEIFVVHRMILQDPSALARVQQRIREERLNAEACVDHLVRKLEETVSGLDGEGVRSYSADISEPWRIVLEALMQSDRQALVSRGGQVVLAAAELTPHVVTCLPRKRVLGVITEAGGRFSHGAVLARSFGFPCVVELPNLLSRLEQGLPVVVDGDAGTVQLDPDQESVDHFLERVSRRKARRAALEVHGALPATTPDGHSLEVMVNVESVRDLDEEGGLVVEHTNGVGLLRTEFMYLERSQFPSEDEQYRLYRRVVQHFAGRPVTIRTLDIGGDKQLPYFRMPRETNPALGWRGLRVSLEWQDLLRVQLRAILRASSHGKVSVLLPMVTSVEEIQRVRSVLADTRETLLEQGYEVAPNVRLGAMIEVPAVLLTLSRVLEEVDFVAVGTNDLVQYLLAADRDNSWVSRLYDPYHPAVIWALREIASTCRGAGKPCSVCGELAGDYATALLLAGMGFDALSVAPNFVTHIRWAVRETPMTELRELARRAGDSRSGEEVRELLEEVRIGLHDRLLGQIAPFGSRDRSKGSHSA